MAISAETRYAIDPDSAAGLDTGQLRDRFLVEGLFKAGTIQLVYSHHDRLVLGSVVPDGGTLVLDEVHETGTPGFLDRREAGILNIGPTGSVSVDGKAYEIDTGEVLYVGKGAGALEFRGAGRFYVLSAPAHQSHPTKLIKVSDARRIEMGSREEANERVIIQFLHPDVCQSCQLLMGYTQFADGSVWNTMPAHLHDRRMEAYLYFGLPEKARVFHFMGVPSETRHIVVANEQAVISPPWSIHSGAGTSKYTFCWGMAGDNVDFADMDSVPMDSLR